jgi:transcriptional regulator with XRE-family HTH domain
MQNLLEKEARYKTALAKAMRLTKEKLFEKDEEEEEQKIVVKKVRKEKGIEQSSFCSEKKIQKESRVQRETMSVAEKLASRAKARKEAKVEEGLVFSSTAEFLRAVGNNADALDTKMFPVKKEKTEAEVEVKKEEEEGEVEEGEVEAEPVAGVLEDEPDVGQGKFFFFSSSLSFEQNFEGLAATLQFLRKNGATGETPSVVARLQDGSVSKKHKVTTK